MTTEMISDDIKKSQTLSKNLQNSLDDPYRKSNGLNILFGDRKKNPSFGWDKWSTPESKCQTDDVIISLFKRRAKDITNWGYAIGHNNLHCLDIDWPFMYHELVQKFGERLDTLTFKTPNDGYHLLFDGSGMSSEEQALLNNRHKNTLHVEVFKSKKYVACYGEAEDFLGNLKPYVKTDDAAIKHDPAIARDILAYLDELLETKYKFVTYNCFSKLLDGKKVHISHEARISIASFLLHDGCSEQETTNFFSICTDYAESETKRQVTSIASGIKTEGYGYPKCETLGKELNWDKESCAGCKRLNVDKKNINIQIAMACRDAYNFYTFQSGPGSTSRYVNDPSGISKVTLNGKNVTSYRITNKPIIVKKMYHGDGERWYECQIDNHSLVLTKDEMLKYIKKMSYVVKEREVNDAVSAIIDEYQKTVPSSHVFGYTGITLRDGQFRLIHPIDSEIRTQSYAAMDIAHSLPKKFDETAMINALGKYHELLTGDWFKDSWSYTFAGYSAIAPFIYEYKRIPGKTPWGFYIAIIGDKNTKKSTISNIFGTQLFGIPDISFRDIQSDFRLAEYLSATTFPRVVGEAENMSRKMQNMLKSSASEPHGTSRGKVDLSLTDYQSRCSLIIHGNSMTLTDDALRERIDIIYTSAEDSLTPQDENHKDKTKDFRELFEIPLGNAQGLVGIELCRMAIETIHTYTAEGDDRAKLRQIVKDIGEKIRQACTDKKIKVPTFRLLDETYPLIYLGLIFWQRLFEKYGLESGFVTIEDFCNSVIRESEANRTDDVGDAGRDAITWMLGYAIDYFNGHKDGGWPYGFSYDDKNIYINDSMRLVYNQRQPPEKRFESPQSFWRAISKSLGTEIIATTKRLITEKQDTKKKRPTSVRALPLNLLFAKGYDIDRYWNFIRTDERPDGTEQQTFEEDQQPASSMVG